MAATRKKTAKKSSSRKSAKKSSKSAKRPAARKKTAKKAARKSSGKKRTPNAAFMKPVRPDATLATVVGSAPLPRTELTKKLWAYIRRKGLQDSKNRRMINADDNLRAVFGGKSQVSMFDMTKLVSRHVS
ncbi:MAG TPA: SWIB/MDM2 domain-containing protein [Gemmatimonadales bacterium]|jgi:chromatin remodeling complex protein RSC6|nr:SWIB/MDM2 domain-containing protein [Gemmatimonadales bacterium]